MSDCPCCSEPWELGEQSAEGDTTTNSNNKFYAQAGFTATITTSQLFTVNGRVTAQSWDGTDTLICETHTLGATAYLRRYSGQFTSTVRSSVDVWASLTATQFINGICWAGASTYWMDRGERMMEQSGNFTSTIRQSVATGGTVERGMTLSGANTAIADRVSSLNFDWLIYSSQFTSTIKSSTRVSSTRFVDYDLDNDGEVYAFIVFDPFDPYSTGKHTKFSGFTSTVNASVAMTGNRGINSNNSITG